MVVKQYLNAPVGRVLQGVTAQQPAGLSVTDPLRPTPLRILNDVCALSPSVEENPFWATVQPESIALFNLTQHKPAWVTRLAEALPLVSFSSQQGPGSIFVPAEKMMGAFQAAFTHFSVVMILGASPALTESLSALARELPSMPVVLLIHAKPQRVVHSLFPEGKQASALVHFVAAFLKS
ncbi:hypothetical protein ACI2I2_11560 [Scandinavium sp. NPDC088450]|uniref:hypothetical protein n=1 Tax=Scandinavium sp. NPDC088450 TaxID=3364514 RepID=UPI003850D11A